MTGFNSKRAMAANKLQEPAQPVADWDSPQVRIVYEILIDGETPPNTDEHWEGFIARKIVAALAQPAQEPVAHTVIAGALFDFMGYLTSRKERIVLSAADDAAPAVDAIRDFATKRGLLLDDAQVREWIDELAQPAQEPVAYVTGMSFGRFIVEPLNPAMVLPVGMALYSSPQGNK